MDKATTPTTTRPEHLEVSSDGSASTSANAARATKEKYHPLDPITTTNFPKSKDDFHWMDTEQIHRIRRRQITKAHPEVRKLYGRDSTTFWIVLGCTFTHIGIFYFLQDKSWTVRLIVGYIFGATINHTLQMATHELSHFLCWKSKFANQLTAILSDLVTGVPSAITFEKYHTEHHLYLAIDVLDPDLPTINEIRWFHNLPMKVLFIFLLPVFYGVRPIIQRPKPLDVISCVNIFAVLIFDMSMVSWLGWWILPYMGFCTLIGLGFHPAAGHLIAEHYEFTENYETYSYYGFWNHLNLNVGYHNEHHDFPKIPYSKLPQLREIAPEFYHSMPQYNSYVKVLWAYITDPNIGPFSRIKRKKPKNFKEL